MAGEVHQVVRDHYAAAAVRAQQQGATDCCGGSSCCSADPVGPISRGLYSAEETAALPAGAVIASLGCGNPTALVDLRPGEVVLDLDPVVGSTCCCPRGGWGLPAMRTGST